MTVQQLANARVVEAYYAPNGDIEVFVLVDNDSNLKVFYLEREVFDKILLKCLKDDWKTIIREYLCEKHLIV